MAGELTTIARPYAEAALAHAEAAGKLDLWSEMLGLLAVVVEDPQLRERIGDPSLGRDNLETLLLEIVGSRFNQEGANFVRLLVRNGRLDVVSEIAALYEKLKNERQGTLEVHITSAFALQAQQKKQLADALQARFGKQVQITAEKDPSLIGGVRIRAGDLVIDGSVRAKLRQLANEFGI
jgi:F-type H+-transporting ATPase subunit delta